MISRQAGTGKKRSFVGCAPVSGAGGSLFPPSVRRTLHGCLESGQWQLQGLKQGHGVTSGLNPRARGVGHIVMEEGSNKNGTAMPLLIWRHLQSPFRIHRNHHEYTDIRALQKKSW